MPTDKQYTGQQLDNSTGLYYYGARFYDASLGRFVSPDTIVPDPKNPQSLNRYSYVYNNPLRYKDPSGHYLESAIDVAFLAYDMHQIASEGWTTANTVALVADLAALALPGITGGGPAARAIIAGGEAAIKVAPRAARVPAGARASQMGLKALQGLDGRPEDEGQQSDDIAQHATEPGIKAIDPPTNRGGLRANMERAGVPKSPGLTNPEAHHRLPWKFKDWFAGKGRGLNVNNAEFGRWVEGTPPGKHQNWTRQYEDAWSEWKAGHENASQQEILEFLAQLESPGRFPSQ